MDIEELTKWIKQCLHALINWKRVRVHSKLDILNKKLIEELFKDGITGNQPRNRKQRVEEAVKAKAGREEVKTKTEKKDKLSFRKTTSGEKNWNYTGIAGDLAGLPTRYWAPLRRMD